MMRDDAAQRRLAEFLETAPFEFFGVPADEPRHEWTERDWLQWLVTGQEPAMPGLTASSTACEVARSAAAYAGLSVDCEFLEIDEPRLAYYCDGTVNALCPCHHRSVRELNRRALQSGMEDKTVPYLQLSRFHRRHSVLGGVDIWLSSQCQNCGSRLFAVRDQHGRYTRKQQGQLNDAAENSASGRG